MSLKSKRRFRDSARIPQFRRVEHSTPPVAALLWILLVVIAVTIIVGIIGVESRSQKDEILLQRERAREVVP